MLTVENIIAEMRNILFDQVEWHMTDSDNFEPKHWKEFVTTGDYFIFINIEMITIYSNIPYCFSYVISKDMLLKNIDIATLRIEIKDSILPPMAKNKIPI